MKINISDEMAEAVIAALKYHFIELGTIDYGKGDYTVSNYEALEFFTEAKDPRYLFH